MVIDDGRGRAGATWPSSARAASIPPRGRVPRGERGPDGPGAVSARSRGRTASTSRSTATCSTRASCPCFMPEPGGLTARRGRGAAARDVAPHAPCSAPASRPHRHDPERAAPLERLRRCARPVARLQPRARGRSKIAAVHGQRSTSRSSTSSRPRAGGGKKHPNTCPNCGSHYRDDELEARSGVCPQCGHHFPVRARERIEQLADEGSFEEEAAELRSATRSTSSTSAPTPSGWPRPRSRRGSATRW